MNNVRQAQTELQLQTNNGVSTTNREADFCNYRAVWYDSNMITNIISLSEARDKGYIIGYDYGKDQFWLQNPRSKAINIFSRHRQGLYYKDLSTVQVNMMNTMEKLKKHYTDWQYKRAKAARKLYQTIGHPSLEDYKKSIQVNAIKNCPVTVEDVNIAEKIFGPDIYTLKGKATRTKPKTIVKDYIEIPTELKEKHESVELCIDIMYVQSVLFLIGIATDLKLVTVVYTQKKRTRAFGKRHQGDGEAI